MTTLAVIHKKSVWKKLLILGRHDLKHIFRDQILTVLFLLPGFMIVLLVLGLPPLTPAFPEISKYYPVITAVACIATAVTPSYVISFIMLDEKDEGVFSVLRVTPISTFGFLAYRLSFVLVFGFIASLLTMLLTHLMEVHFLVAVALSFLVALAAPLVTLCIVTYASNKIEGITFLKGINFISMLPVIGFFAAPFWHIPLALIPVYWTYQAFDATVSVPDFVLFYTISLLVHIGLIAWLFRQFMKRVF
jgi:fluoroquinolone transport system permease protein